MTDPSVPDKGLPGIPAPGLALPLQSYSC